MTEHDANTRTKRVMQADSLRSHAWKPSWELPLTMNSDETNNIRRLRLLAVGLNAPADKVFMLAGIALKAGKTLTGPVSALLV